MSSTPHIADEDFVICWSDDGNDGWSLHAPGSTDEDIADGTAAYLVTGLGRPKARDFAAARRAMAAQR